MHKTRKPTEYVKIIIMANIPSLFPSNKSAEISKMAYKTRKLRYELFNSFLHNFKNIESLPYVLLY